MRKILVTGGTGYIGSNLIASLLEAGYEVHATKRKSSSTEQLKGVGDQISFHTIDGSYESVRRIFQNNPIDCVIHLAAWSKYQVAQEDIRELFEATLLFGTHLIQAAVDYQVKYFINVGTYFQHFKGESYNPVNLYAASKQAFEDIARFYTETSPLRFLTLKLMDTYGPRDPRNKIMKLLMKIALSGEELSMSPGEQRMGLVYITDVVKAFFIAIEKIQRQPEHTQSIYFVRPHEFLRLKDIVDIFQEVIQRPMNIQWGEKPYREREILLPENCDPNILEGESLVSLKEGVTKMLLNENLS